MLYHIYMFHQQDLRPSWCHFDAKYQSEKQTIRKILRFTFSYFVIKLPVVDRWLNSNINLGHSSGNKIRYENCTWLLENNTNKGVSNKSFSFDTLSIRFGRGNQWRDIKHNFMIFMGCMVGKFTMQIFFNIQITSMFPSTLRKACTFARLRQTSRWFGY